MDTRFVQRAAIFCLIFFLIWILLFSGSPQVQKRPPVRDLKNTPLDDLVWRYIYGVRACLRDGTDPLEVRPEPFLDYWRRLPVLADECSVNAQMSVRSYSASKKFNMFFVPNMNRSTENEKCTIISYIGAEYPDLSQKLKRESPNCEIKELSPISHGDSVEDVVKQVNSEEVVNSLFISPTSTDAHAVIDLLSAKSVLSTTVCQVNILYPEPTIRRHGQFVDDFNRLLTDGRYLLLRAEKDFSSTLMNLFFVNFEDEFCRKRYFRMFTFD